jgi:hypothetical protein
MVLETLISCCYNFVITSKMMDSPSCEVKIVESHSVILYNPFTHTQVSDTLQNSRGARRDKRCVCGKPYDTHPCHRECVCKKTISLLWNSLPS